MAGVANTFRSPLPMSAAVFLPWTHATVASPRMPCRERQRVTAYNALLVRAAAMHRSRVLASAGTRAHVGRASFAPRSSHPARRSPASRPHARRPHVRRSAHRLDVCARGHPGPEAAVLLACALQGPPQHDEPKRAQVGCSVRGSGLESVRGCHIQGNFVLIHARRTRGGIEANPTRCSTTQRRALRAWRSCRLPRSCCRCCASCTSPLLPSVPQRMLSQPRCAPAYAGRAYGARRRGVLLLRVARRASGKGVRGALRGAPACVPDTVSMSSHSATACREDRGAARPAALGTPGVRARDGKRTRCVRLRPVQRGFRPAAQLGPWLRASALQ